MDKSIETEHRLVVVRGIGGGRMGRNCYMGKGFYFGVMEMFLGQIELVVAQHL